MIVMIKYAFNEVYLEIGCQRKSWELLDQIFFFFGGNNYLTKNIYCEKRMEQRERNETGIFLDNKSKNVQLEEVLGTITVWKVNFSFWSLEEV